MGEKRNGAGAALGSVLERATPRRERETIAVDLDPVEPDPADEPEPEPAPKSRANGSAAAGKGKGRARRADVTGRTIYLPDDLHERVFVQARRRKKTLSEYVEMILNRHVPDHRTIRSESGSGDG